MKIWPELKMGSNVCLGFVNSRHRGLISFNFMQIEER